MGSSENSQSIFVVDNPSKNRVIHRGGITVLPLVTREGEEIPSYINSIDYPLVRGSMSAPKSAIISPPPIRALHRKRGKSMSRRKGQNPKLRIGTRNSGTQYFYFQYWLDVPGIEERKRRREILGPVKTAKSAGLTKTEAEAKKMQFLAELNGRSLTVPSSKTFADAVKHYREVFAPRMLRDSTFSVADGHLKNHLEPDWNNTPVGHITIKTVNDWAWKKKRNGLSWVTVKNILRTMQRVLSASSEGRVPFSQDGLAIPERDKMQMNINSRKHVSYSWDQALRIVKQLDHNPQLGDGRREQYRSLFLVAAASGLRIGELLALKTDDIDFELSTVRVDESVGRMRNIGPCKNVTAYRTVVLADSEGRAAMQSLKDFLKHDGLVFQSQHGGPLAETTILTQGLHPAVTALNLPKAGMHAFRRGCNRRWELARVSGAVIRQQMGHATADMTTLYTGEIPVEQVLKQFQLEPNGAAVAA
jgi:integrase